MDGSQRRLFVCLTAVAGACVLAQAATGAPELVLFLAPLFLVGAMLLSGNYVAEERIVKRWREEVWRPVRRVRMRWRFVSETAPASLLERGPHCERGPPAPVSLAA